MVYDHNTMDLYASKAAFSNAKMLTLRWFARDVSKKSCDQFLWMLLLDVSAKKYEEL